MTTPAPTKQLGITPPLSTALPSDSEKQASAALIEELKRQNNYESAAETQKRSVVLQSLQNITEEFVKIVLRSQGIPESLVNSAGGRIFTYGSFRLGVFGPGSDIDTLIVVPAKVTRDDYFKYFPDLLVKMAPPGAITDLTPVPDAFVPIIKFEYSGISIDLIFCALASLNAVPKTLTLKDDELLKGLDETELRCINGTRVTDEILDLVPQPGVFRTALRGIKLWAQRRAIYANIMGFPGGVAWAMLVARVCQLYPQATSSTIILKFFRIMEKWQWPQPVLLKQITTGKLAVRVWNPKVYKGDSFHLMPIITPAYPSMCATHNITKSTKEIINRELARGGNVTDQIMMGKLPWKELFVKHTFFTKNYKYYLSIISASTTQQAQLIWSGLVESKVRHLVVGLESHESIALAHPFNKGFEREHKCSSEEEVEKAKEGDLQFQLKEGSTETKEEVNDSDSKNDVKENGEQKADEKKEGMMVYTTTFYIGLELQEGAKSLDLSWQVEEFKKMCMNWEKYDADLNALSVIHTRNCDLPDDVFSEGEVKPTRPLKKKKRNASDDVGQAPAKRQQVVAAG
ncbi:Poly(A) polymerase protein [Rutstroemia sp. NJR-2017a BBW]|nr:Poly(A) polymerase protein [Rutstroemia sp. NJR-2017a BBW]